jgi:hypothetical protein
MVTPGSVRRSTKDGGSGSASHPMRDDGCGSLDWNPPGSPIAGGRGWSSPINDNGAGADGGAPTDLGPWLERRTTWDRELQLLRLVCERKRRAEMEERNP